MLSVSGDNGPAPGQHQIMYFNSQGPFRGFKTTVMEGGIRQTVTVQWPGHIAAGRTTEHIFTFWDFLPTAAELAGAPLPPRIDGISAVSVMLGEVDGAAPPQPRTLYYEFCWNSVMNTPEKIAKVTMVSEDCSSVVICCCMCQLYCSDYVPVCNGLCRVRREI
jgi:hypothetical protein